MGEWTVFAVAAALLSALVLHARSRRHARARRRAHQLDGWVVHRRPHWVAVCEGQTLVAELAVVGGGPVQDCSLNPRGSKGGTWCRWRYLDGVGVEDRLNDHLWALARAHQEKSYAEVRKRRSAEFIRGLGKAGDVSIAETPDVVDVEVSRG